MADEKRLIDAKPLMQNGWHLVKIGESNRFFGSMSLADIPTVDAVEVVRCRNCQEFKPGFIRPYLGWCGVWDTTVRETGFCHHGKPRCGEGEKPVWPPEEEPEVACED